MISGRYRNDGRATLGLSKLQRGMRDAVTRKVESGEYVFEHVPCPICEGTQFEPLAEKDRYGLYFPVVVCVDCGLVQTNPRMTQESYDRFYNAEYRPLLSGGQTPTARAFQRGYARGRRILGYVSANLADLPSRPLVVEVGCGAGGILRCFADHGWEARGCDLGAEYLEYGRQHGNLDLQVGTLKDLSLDRAPDLVIYSHVLEHILEPARELERVRHVLRDEGFLYVEVPGVRSLSDTRHSDFLQELQNAHVYHFTLTTLTNLLARVGFVRRTGNESIESLFAKGDPRAVPSTEYPDIVRYLRSTERIRRRNLVRPRAWPWLARRVVVKTLAALHMKERVRRLAGE